MSIFQSDRVVRRINNRLLTGLKYGFPFFFSVDVFSKKITPGSQFHLSGSFPITDRD